MKKRYLYIFLLLVITSFSVQAQTGKNNGISENTRTESSALDKVQIYPNPVTNGKIYVNSESNSYKAIELYDMLGKRVLATDMTSSQKELNVVNLKAGVYILKVSDKTNSISRKIIIK
ncbi:MAG TPA: T9SS type A sorting domain-containing protein [Flavobacterium sp.]|nr:T9SS type A sorting domain-containing protein [Flavobacterium sp.]